MMAASYRIFIVDLTEQATASTLTVSWLHNKIQMTEKKEIFLNHRYLSSALLLQTFSLRKAGRKVYIRRPSLRSEKKETHRYLVLKVKTR